MRELWWVVIGNIGRRLTEASDKRLSMLYPRPIPDLIKEILCATNGR